MTSADYAHYSITEFLEDDYFLQWATARDERNDSFWRTFLTEFPEQEATIREALTIVQVYRAQETFGNDGRIDAVARDDRLPVAHRRAAERIDPDGHA